MLALMNKRLLLLWISALFLLAGTALAACGDDDDDDGGGGGTSTSAAEVDTLKPGTLVVGVDVPYPPFEQGRPPDYEGFEIDWNEIASRLGLRETEIQGHPVRLRSSGDLAQEKFRCSRRGAPRSSPSAGRSRGDSADPWANTEQSLPVQEGQRHQVTLADVEG